MTLSDSMQALSKTLLALAAIFGVSFGAVNYFQTDAEAQAYQQQHQSELVRFRIQQLEQQISQIRYQLLSSKLAPEQREWLIQELKRLEDMKKCILAGQC